MKQMEHFIQQLFASSLDDMKNRIIEGEAKVYSFGLKVDIDEHVAMLRQEFIGRTELELYHAVLMSLVRREVDLLLNLERVHELWSKETEFLCQNVDSRWLVSACDTMMDHWPNESDRALAAAGSLFTNTLKLYETERWATGQYDKNNEYEPVSGRVPLHDGLSGFVIGWGDMIANLHRRIKSVCANSSPAACILFELLHRASENNTVYKRFKDVHQRSETGWSRDKNVV